MKKQNSNTPLTDAEIASNLQALGKRLQELRKKKGYSNYETFAYEHNLPRAQYGRYERGLDLKVSSLLKVIHALGITPTEFFDGIGQE